MEISYWKARWQKDKTGWHMNRIYPHLPDFWPGLQLSKGATVLVPLCGKSLDMLWLKNQNYDVIGIEVSEKAAKEFFMDNRLMFEKSSKASFTIYETDNLAIWAGDFFKSKKDYLPGVDAIYDKAALIALPYEQRIKYADKILSLCQSHTQILMNAFEYEQEEMTGPPFAVLRKELDELFGQQFNIELLHEESIFDNLTKFQHRGLSSYLIEKLYHLRPLN